MTPLSYSAACDLCPEQVGTGRVLECGGLTPLSYSAACDLCPEQVGTGRVSPGDDILGDM
ncbi:MAG TPA: hypothetical protein PKZ53_06780 [Acidobacteriota bacterium]|nr:hypothetical protein [Acidobacteriota bacterium]